MTDFKLDLRHYCRNPKCRMKLREPVAGPRAAFCTKGCHSSFYRRRCLICEQPMQRRTENQRLCGKRRCRNALKARSALGGIHPFEKSIKPGLKTSPQRRPASLFANAPLNILGGGSWVWPNTSRLSADTLQKILLCEIGALVAVGQAVTS
jgi:hypothetical protein